jgi:predicted molibdopterin-dependent oxidoreductase YjgC
MTNSITEIRDAELLFVIGSNTTEAHPIIAMEMKRALNRGAKLIVADPRQIWLARHADIHLQLRPGTDVWLLNAIAHTIVTEGLHDPAFIAEHTENFEALVKNLLRYTPEEAEKITGVPAELIRQTARLYAGTKKAGIYYTLGITEHTHGTDNVYGLANLVLMTGHLGVRSAGLNPLRGQNNVQGANDAGASPLYYAGYQKVDDPAAQAKFEALWGVDLSPDPGLNLNEMMHELGDGGKIRGMYIMGEDILVSEPNLTNVVDGVKKHTEFLVVQDIFMTETAKCADVVLPATCFAEKDGVFTNSDRRVQRVRKAVDPPGLARADWQILCDVARAAGYEMPQYAHPSEVYAEMASQSPQFAGISHDRIDKAGIQWPCPDSDHPGTEMLHEDGPMVGLAKFQVIDYRPSAESPDPDYPFNLATGRTLYHYNVATQTRRDAGPVAKQPRNFIEIHPRDARRLTVSHGDRVRVRSRRGAVKADVHITRTVQPGCVWMPFHFAEDSANLLTNDAGDPVTETAEFKVCAVQIEALL